MPPSQHGVSLKSWQARNHQEIKNRIKKRINNWLGVGCCTIEYCRTLKLPQFCVPPWYFYKKNRISFITRFNVLKFYMDVGQTFINMLVFSDFCKVPARGHDQLLDQNPIIDTRMPMRSRNWAMVLINGYFDLSHFQLLLVRGSTYWHQTWHTGRPSQVEYLCQKLCSRDVPTRRDVRWEYTFC